MLLPGEDSLRWIAIARPILRVGALLPLRPLPPPPPPPPPLLLSTTSTTSGTGRVTTTAHPLRWPSSRWMQNSLGVKHSSRIPLPGEDVPRGGSREHGQSCAAMAALHELPCHTSVAHDPPLPLSDNLPTLNTQSCWARQGAGRSSITREYMIAGGTCRDLLRVNVRAPSLPPHLSSSEVHSNQSVVPAVSANPSRGRSRKGAS